MKRSCENCQWWGDTHQLKPEQGDCQNPAVVDISGSPAGKGFGIGVEGQDLMTEPRFGCVHFTTPSPQARTRLRANNFHEVGHQVRAAVERTERQDEAAKIIERLAEYLESLSETEQAHLLQPALLRHVIRIFTSAL